MSLQVLVIVILISVSLITKEIISCLLISFICCYVCEMPGQLFVHLKNTGLSLCSYWFTVILKIYLGHESFFKWNTTNIFYSGLPLHSLHGVFCQTDVLNCNIIQLIFFFQILLFVYSLRKSCLLSDHEDVFMFFLKSFIFFTHHIEIHCLSELIFVCVMW